MQAANGNKPLCPRCRKGPLALVIEYTDAGKIEVVKCSACSHRVAERDYVTKAGDTAEQGDVMETRQTAGPGRARSERGTRNTPPCADCARPGMKLVARGLCTTCWKGHNAAGTLEQFPVKTGKKQPKKPVADAPKTPPKAPVEQPVPSAPVTEADEPQTAAGAASEMVVPLADGPRVEGSGFRTIATCYSVSILFEDSRDRNLLKRLLSDAHASRRTLDQQILLLVETAYAAESAQ